LGQVGIRHVVQQVQGVLNIREPQDRKPPGRSYSSHTKDRREGEVEGGQILDQVRVGGPEPTHRVLETGRVNHHPDPDAQEQNSRHAQDDG
jgi:hypothetical protein